MSKNVGEVAKKAKAPSGSVAAAVDAAFAPTTPLARHRVGASAPNSNWSPNLTVRASRERETWARRPEDANSRRTVRGSIASRERERRERE